MLSWNDISVIQKERKEGVRRAYWGLFFSLKELEGIFSELYVVSNVIGQVLFERTPLNELFDKTITNQNPENDRNFRFGEI